MWSLGRDAKRRSAGDRFGEEFRALDVPALYYWSAATTPASTPEYIATHSIPNRRYNVASHWPVETSPRETAEAIADFFGNAV